MIQLVTTPTRATCEECGFRVDHVGYDDGMTPLERAKQAAGEHQETEGHPTVCTMTCDVAGCGTEAIWSNMRGVVEESPLSRLLDLPLKRTAYAVCYECFEEACKKHTQERQ